MKTTAEGATEMTNSETLTQYCDRQVARIRAIPEAERSKQNAEFLSAWENHRRTSTSKQARLSSLVERMHPRDRRIFLAAREKFKPNLDHDLFVASLHVPPRGVKFSA